MNKGHFTGSYFLRRVGPGEWEYIPDPDEPLTFHRPDGEPIVVTEMFGTTDLGSVPRFLWWIPGLSPTDLERPSILHDALFLRHKAGKPSHGFRESNAILAEACIAEGYSPYFAAVIKWACDTFGKKVWDAPPVKGRPYSIVSRES